MALSLVIKHKSKAKMGNMCASRESKTWILSSGFIPWIPSSWKDALGPGLFQILLQWRSAALSRKSQAHLDSDFKMVVEDFIPGKPGQGKHQKSCRAKSEPSPNGGTPASADADVDDEEVKPKIQLATKSHHTEHSS